MRIVFFCSLFLYFGLSLHRLSYGSDLASLPPRGWNSYDSFSWIISEEEFLKNAEIVSQRLLPHGYEYVVVDYLWYRRKVPGAYSDSHGFDVIDEWGRMVPDTDRWPSSKGGKGFTEVANKVHSMGLKFGIHVMRGVSRQAYDANTPILDTKKGGAFKDDSGQEWHAQDIGIKERSCAWMQNGFMSVNTQLEAGRAFLRSLYEQFAEWGVDFVKNDCVFGDDLDLNEITFVSEVIKQLQRPILYSLSPGTSVTPSLAKEISGLVNMYRVTGDDWDTWRDVASHFDVSRDFSNANMIGANGLNGKSWPDLDMLPLGWLTDPGSNDGPHRNCNLNLNEQRTQMTLWAMAKSPLMFGGDARSLDDSTFSLITNPTILEINSFTLDNKEFPYVTSREVTTVKTKAPARQSRRWALKIVSPDVTLMNLRSCKDPNANGWSIEALDKNVDQICWKQNLGIQEPLCLYKRKALFASDEQIVYNQGNHHLFPSNTMQFCFDASPRKRLTSKVSTRGSFSHCRRDANQLWELRNDGALVSNYSGLCAVVNSVKANDVPSGIRSWIATGRTGEIYIAFFNLNPEQTEISAKISDLGKALPGNLVGGSCKCSEVWSGKDFGVVTDSITMAVETHGCALFVLNCH